MENLSQQSLSEIVLDRHEAIPVFEKYNLDFCCGGKKTLEKACAEKQIPTEQVVKEIEEGTRTISGGLDFREMNAEQLIGYIISHHHFYVQQSIPQISLHIDKVVEKHGDTYPGMIEVQRLFSEVQAELYPHMLKEEQILFPRIREIENASSSHIKPEHPDAWIESPIAVMEQEHESAGQLMASIREVTNHYTPPETACTTHRLCLAELKAFEKDLHRHVHLENNILFPMAERMMHSLS